MPPLTKRGAHAIGVANAHATGHDALAGAALATRGLAPPASDVAFSLGHPTLPTAVIFQTSNGVLDELPLEFLTPEIQPVHPFPCYFLIYFSLFYFSTNLSFDCSTQRWVTLVSA